MVKHPPFKNVLVIDKPSFYRLHRHERAIRDLYRRRDPVMTKYLLADQEHQKSLEMVQGILEASRIRYRIIQRPDLGSVAAYDLLITLGGDGTILRASHRVINTPILAIKASPSASMGALCQMTSSDFKKNGPRLLAGHFDYSIRARLEVLLNGRALPAPALNDVLFANQYSGGTSRYQLRVGRIHENQVSSGVWFATGSGSTGVIHSAGGVVLPPESDAHQYVVREPYSAGHGFNLLKGVVSGRTSITIKSLMRDGALFIDGLQYQRAVHFGDQIVIRRSPCPLRLIRHK